MKRVEWPVAIPRYFAILALIVVGIGLSVLMFRIELSPGRVRVQYITITSETSDGSMIQSRLRVDRGMATPAAPDLKESQPGPSTDRTLKLHYIRDLFLNVHPMLGAWIFAVIVLAGTSFGFVLPAIATIQDVAKTFGIGRPIIAVCIVLALLLITAALFFADGALLSMGSYQLRVAAPGIMQDLGIVFKKPYAAMALVFTLASIGSCVAIVGLLATVFAANNLRRRHAESIDMSHVARLRDASSFLLVIIAVCITGSVVTTSLLRKALLSFLPANLSFLFPVEFVYIYGLAFSVFLAALYLPFYFELRHAIMHVRDSRRIQEKDTDKSDIDPAQAPFRGNVVRGQTLVETLKIVLTILAPLLTSLLGK